MKYILLIFILVFSACSLKHYDHTKTKIIIIKSPKIKFADVGYIRNSGDSIELELFIAGNCIERISINHLICVRGGCMTKGSFNRDYLNHSYPSDILQNILLGEPVYEAVNMVKTQDGFKQRIDDGEVLIEYEVTPYAVVFKDKKSGILFKIKDTQERKNSE